MTKKLSTIMAAVLLICVIISISCMPVMAAGEKRMIQGYTSFLDLYGGYHQGSAREYTYDSFEISMTVVDLYNARSLPEIPCQVVLGYESTFLWIQLDIIEEASAVLVFSNDGDMDYNDFGRIGRDKSNISDQSSP